MRVTQPPGWLPTVGDQVIYADGVYDIAAVNDDLLTLEGVADWQSRRCRVRVTVLASDVTVRAWQREQ